MLNQGIKEMEFGADGKVTAIKDGDKIAKTKMVIASPAYLIASGQSDKVKQVGQTIRCICILGEQVPCIQKNSSSKNPLTSGQIIIPQRQTGRKSGKLLSISLLANGSRHLCDGCRLRACCLR